jgi:hypothetical protein
MAFDSVHLWRRFSQVGGLLVMSALVGTVLFHHIYSFNKQLSKSSTSIQPKALISQVSPQPIKHTLNHQIAELSRLYQAAPKLSVDQFIRRESSELENVALGEDYSSTATAVLNTPIQYRIDADRSNFGDRLSRNAQGNAVDNKLLIVLHETTSAASGAVNTALTPHKRDEDQVSYHAVIGQDGAIIYLVDPRKRAYGAGNSVFRWREGFETVQTNKRLKSSVNNFAYHISLETPPDGYNEKPSHMGYSSAQYTSLAWLIAHSGVEENRITTHYAIDRLGERQDPRSFEMSWLQQNLALYNIFLTPTDTNS